MKKLSMAKISIMVSIAFFAILFAVIVILLNFSGIVKGTEKNNEPYRVGLILDGARDDKSWGQSHYAALGRVAQEMNIEVICRENVPADENFDNTVADLVENESCRVIVAASYFFGDRLGEVTAKYPDTYFMHASGLDSGENLCSFYGRMYQYRYLCGIIAGTQTKKGNIGYVAAFPTVEVNRGLNAFTLGVRSVKPDARVYVSFSNSWKDSEHDRAASEKLINEYGIDVLSQHTDTLAPLEAADEHGVLSIGCNFNNCYMFPETYIAACVWKWDGFYKERLLACMQGRFKGKHFWLGSESGIMELVIPTRAEGSDAYRKPLEAAREKFASRTFDVFYGPVNDSSGTQRIAAGESMSDESMLKKFDWYTEGVVIVEQT